MRYSSMRLSSNEGTPSPPWTPRPWACRLLALLLLFALPCGDAEAKKKKKEAAQTLAPVFYPPAPGEPRFQFLGVISSSRQFKKKGGMNSFLFGQGQGAVDLVRPYGVVFEGGKLHVCDSGAGAAFTLDIGEGTASSFNLDHPQLRLGAPINLHLGASGRMYATDPRAGKLLVLDEEERPRQLLLPGRRFEFGESGGMTEAQGDCLPPPMSPAAVVEHEGELFVADLRGGRITVLDAETGCLLRELAGDPEDPNRLSKPANLAIGPQGYLYVTDTVRGSVTKWDRSGRFVRRFGSLGRRAGQFVRPKGIAVDDEGRFYVVDAATQVVQVFNADGQLLLALGQPGQDRGGLDMPAGIALATDDTSLAYGRQLAAPGFELEYLVLVTNQMGPNKVNLYGFGQRRTGGDG